MQIKENRFSLILGWIILLAGAIFSYARVDIKTENFEEKVVPIVEMNRSEIQAMRVWGKGVDTRVEMNYELLKEISADVKYLRKNRR